jgi:hypothetical protein
LVVLVVTRLLRHVLGGIYSPKPGEAAAVSTFAHVCDNKLLSLTLAALRPGLRLSHVQFRVLSQ